MLGTVAAVLWIFFDVMATLVTAPPLPFWLWDWVVYGGIAVALFTLGVGFRESKQREGERKEDREHFAKSVEGSQSLKADIAAIDRKLEPPEKKIEEIKQRIEEWNPSQQMINRRWGLVRSIGAYVDAQKRSSGDHPKNANSN